MPGTQAGSRPVPGMRSRPEALVWAMVRLAGIEPWPHITSVLPRLHRVEDQRHVAARAAQMRLDDLQGEGRGDRRVEGVAAPLQDAHADRGGDPVRGGDDAEGADDLGPGGERVGIDEFHGPASKDAARDLKPETLSPATGRARGRLSRAGASSREFPGPGAYRPPKAPARCARRRSAAWRAHGRRAGADLADFLVAEMHRRAGLGHGAFHLHREQPLPDQARYLVRAVSSWPM